MEENALKQNARIKWLQLGDSNSHYFHQAIKARESTNRIDCLMDDNGHEVTAEDKIQVWLRSSIELLGTRKLRHIDITVVIRKGRLLRKEAGSLLIAPMQI